MSTTEIADEHEFIPGPSITTRCRHRAFDVELGKERYCHEPEDHAVHGCRACQAVEWIRFHIGPLCSWQERVLHQAMLHSCDHPKNG